MSIYTKNKIPVANSYDEQASLLDVAKPVKCYRNLRDKKFSVLQGGLVRFHTTNIRLKDVSFVVNERIRQQVVARKCKQVHAFVVGFLDGSPRPIEDECVHGVFYNPYKVETFVLTDTNRPIECARYCELEKTTEGRMLVFVSSRT